MASSRKRPRPSDSENRQERVQEKRTSGTGAENKDKNNKAGKGDKDKDKDNRAECPFQVHIVDPSLEEKKLQQKNKKRRRTTVSGSSVDATADGEEENNTSPADKIHFQASPFKPNGKFRNYPNMDVHYKVEPAKEWLEMTRYNSFVLNNVKYFAENYIYVANDLSIKKRDPKDAATNLQRRETEWVAKILEIRAKDEHHVFARVYWMYWPDELPGKTRDRKRIVEGRQPYHGQHELVASNHMDIINVVSVTEPAVVNQWFEENDEETQDSLYWRQAYDVRGQELSTAALVCACNTPANPDKLLVGCSSESCKKWLHEECIKDQALRATFERLGTDKPHIPLKKEEPVSSKKEEEKDTKDATKPKTEPNGVDVKPKAENGIITTNGNGALKPDDATEAEADTSGLLPLRSTRRTRTPTAKAQSPTPVPTTSATTSTAKTIKTEPASVKKGPGRPRKIKSLPATATVTKAAKVTNKERPWEGLFSVTLEMDGTPYLEFTDLRTDVTENKGGAKKWREEIKCLVCGELVN